MTADTTERGLEALIVDAMKDRGWTAGQPRDYDRDYCVDITQLREFLSQTQPDLPGEFDLAHDGPTRRTFLARLQGAITKRGVIDVLRGGLKHGPHEIDLFYGSASAGNVKAQELFALNRFSVTRQLRYSRDETQLALDLGLFINGLPVATFELKNNLTKQTVEDAVEQYQRDRDPRERLFEFGRCIVHFAADDQEIRFCTQLKGKQSWFLPFNRGWHDGAGNPPNPDGIKTDYLWKQILTPVGLTDIIENYAQVVVSKDPKTGKKSAVQIFPRFHQLGVVRQLLADVAAHGAGRRYLVQHSAGSGKSNSIAWLVHQLIGLEAAGEPVLDSVIVVTDRKVLDRQIRNTIKQFAQVSATIGAAEHSGDLKTFLASGKKIIITTVQKFPFVLNDIGDEHRDRKFGIVIDEAHSSQGGRTAAALNEALAQDGGADEEEDPEDRINRIMEARKMLPNASYFAFTATPKNKTLEIFGQPVGQDGEHRPFHSYTMKQAIQEGFILDVLANYTPVRSYYKLVSTVEGDPEFDVRRASKKLRRYVESNDHAIRLKAEIMVDHFHDHVLGLQKIGGQARAMVVTGSVERAIQYYHAIEAYLRERKSPCQAVVAFSGEHDYRGVKVTEGSLNGFPEQQDRRRDHRGPVSPSCLRRQVSDRLRRAADALNVRRQASLGHQGRADAFAPEPCSSQEARCVRPRLHERHRRHRTRILRLLPHDNPQRGDRSQQAARPSGGPRSGAGLRPEPGQRVRRPLSGRRAAGPAPDPILDACVATYNEELDEDGQVDFKGNAKAFTRSYGFLGSILPYTNASWEKLSIFLTFLIPKLPAPKEDDLSRGILEIIDMDSYRVEKQKAMQIALVDEDAAIGPVPTARGGYTAEPELDRLSNILKTLNDEFGNIEWTDSDRVERLITEEIPTKVAADQAYRNAQRNNDKQNARIEHDKALGRVMNGLLKDDTELFKQFSDNESFRRVANGRRICCNLRCHPARRREIATP